MFESNSDIGKIEVGERCLCGKILFVWEDPDDAAVKWVVIKNDSIHAPKDTFSIYRHRTDLSDGNLSTFHFLPVEILKKLSMLDDDDLRFSERIDHRIYFEKSASKSTVKKDTVIKSSSKAKKNMVIKKEAAIKKKAVIAMKKSFINEEKKKAVIPKVEKKEGKKPFNDIFDSID